jgi:hypothetical protein
MLIVTVGIPPVDSSCLKPWESVLLQEDRRIIATGYETSDKPDQYVAVAALSWTHSREFSTQSAAPRTFIYPMEAAGFMDLVKSGRQHMLQQDYEQIGFQTAGV